MWENFVVSFTDTTDADGILRVHMSTIPEKAVQCFFLTLEWCLRLTEQRYDGQLPVATVIIDTAMLPRCLLLTALLRGVTCRWPFDPSLQLISRRPLLKSPTTQTSKVKPSRSPVRWTGGARDASRNASTPPVPNKREIITWRKSIEEEQANSCLSLWFLSTFLVNCVFYLDKIMINVLIWLNLTSLLTKFKFDSYTDSHHNIYVSAKYFEIINSLLSLPVHK